MSFLSRLLFPPKCAACKVLLDWYETDGVTALCPSCLEKWIAEKNVTCGICGKKVTHCSCVTGEMRKARCAGFRKLTYYQGRTREPVPNRLIYHIKESRSAQTHAFLARELQSAIEELLPCAEDRQNAVLTFVPRSRSAKMKYGTDQAEELVRALAKVTDLPCRKLIRRASGRGGEQKTLSASARLKNATHSFVLSRGVDVRGKTVVLVDDIVTTGASMATCTRLLRHVGAQQVYCLSIASNDVNREIT